MLTIHGSWNGTKHIIRFTDKYYRNDLKTAIKNCGLAWSDEIFGRCYDRSATVRIDDSIDHPAQSLYEEWFARCETT
jgi:hypothetical protein